MNEYIIRRSEVLFFGIGVFVACPEYSRSLNLVQVDEVISLKSILDELRLFRELQLI
jgi:hypothetical protein